MIVKINGVLEDLNSVLKYNMKKYYLFLLIIIIGTLFNCAGKKIQFEDELVANYNKALKFFNNGKYVRAKDEFQYIIMTDPGSKIANESQYYKAEALFLMKEYEESWDAFDQYIRFTNDIEKIEKSRFRICECAIASTNFYQRDQKQTIRAVEQLQMFLEDFPNSELIQDAEKEITELRNKLARKEYEVGRLYLKLEEYESALIYFRSVLNNYYDTNFADDARIGIIFTHILNENRKGAKNYYKAEKNRFINIKKELEAKSLIKNTEKGLSLNHYFQLYK